jgi:hypothetical protein
MRLHRKKYRDLIDLMSTYNMIKNYIRNRRDLIGDNNNLDELKRFADKLKYKHGITRFRVSIKVENLAQKKKTRIFERFVWTRNGCYNQ